MNNPKTISLHVAYTRNTTGSFFPQSQTVEVPADTAPEALPDVVRELICPVKRPDPSDGYRGQSPSSIVILSMTNLTQIMQTPGTIAEPEPRPSVPELLS